MTYLVPSSKSFLSVFFVKSVKMSLSRLAAFDERRRRQYRIASIPLTRLCDRQNPLEWYNAVEFKMRYHLYKDTAIFVSSLIENELNYPVRRGVHVPAIIQFLAVLRFYSTGAFQISNADLHNLSQPTISNLIKRVSEAIAKMRDRFVKFPSFAEATKTRREFYAISGFPGKIYVRHMKCNFQTRYSHSQCYRGGGEH